jgi:tRNA-dihydrouridine synthase
MERLIQLYVAYFGETHAARMLRGRLTWFVKGLPGSSAFRRDLARIETPDQAIALIRAYESLDQD